MMPDYFSVFISYGSPDTDFADLIYDNLKKQCISSFYFSKTAVPGEKLHRTMFDGINSHDRVLLICSRASLRRNGFLNELEQVLIREASEGGTERIIPIIIDDYLFKWQPRRLDLAKQLRSRVVADFRNTITDESLFQDQFCRLLAALEKR